MRPAPLPSCPPLPPVIGHRGAAASAPENTLAGLRTAKALGCQWVEFDVRLTADKALVLCHDARLERTTNGRGRVAAFSAEALRRYDSGSWFGPEFAGEPVPTLDETLVCCAALGLGANIEIKAEFGAAWTTAAAVAACLGRLRGKLPPILISSFVPGAVAKVRKIVPDVPRGILFQKIPRRWAKIAARLGCATVNVDHNRLSAPLVGEIRRAGYPVLAYTVNDPQRARRLFDWGVTSVFSDAPNIILAAMASDGASAPTPRATQPVAAR